MYFSDICNHLCSKVKNYNIFIAVSVKCAAYFYLFFSVKHSFS